MKIQGDEISGYESSMGRKFRHENTIYVNEIYEYSIDPNVLMAAFPIIHGPTDVTFRWIFPLQVKTCRSLAVDPYSIFGSLASFI